MYQNCKVDSGTVLDVRATAWLKHKACSWRTALAAWLNGGLDEELSAWESLEWTSLCAREYNMLSTCHTVSIYCGGRGMGGAAGCRMRSVIWFMESEAQGVVYMKGFWVEITYLFNKTSVGIKSICCKVVDFTFSWTHTDVYICCTSHF